MNSLSSNALFCFTLSTGDHFTRFSTFCKRNIFFHFTHTLNHDLNVIIDNFVLETSVFSITLIPFDDSLAFLWDQYICSPFWIYHRVLITKVWTYWTSLLIDFVWNRQGVWSVLLLFRDYDISSHFVQNNRSRCIKKCVIKIRFNRIIWIIVLL